ncbi:MAG: T9SS C-terminal target domain-containing protein [Flavobacteriales bacterium]|nr:T9SS C-terminal target domain-containing protein [Flavobacteriales bacterium]
MSHNTKVAFLHTILKVIWLYLLIELISIILIFIKNYSMKFALPLLIFLCVSSFAQENNPTCSKRDRFKNQHLKSNTLNVAQIAETEKYDVVFYGLDLAMTNTSTYLSGTVRIDAKAKLNLDSALFELFPTLVISEIRLNGSPTSFSRSGTAVKAFVGANAGQTFSLEIDYSGNPPTAQTNPLGGSGITAGSSPSWGNKVVWTLSEPFSAMEWFPCKQSLTDKADSSFCSITVPDTLMAGANGKLVSIDTLGNGFLTFNWEHRHPIDYYLISTAVAKYVDYSFFVTPTGAPNPILVQNYIYNNPQTLTNFINDINETGDFIELFYEKYGPYPFEDEKYGHCMAPISGGMEHQTMTTQGFFEKKLTSHELAHQWWGNNVTCASWCDIWLNEGFASYSEYLMLENLYPADKDQHMLDVHDNVKTQTGGSVWVLDSLNESRIFSGRLTYDKGAAIIHTMRFMLNDDSLFFEVLKDFQQSFKDSVAHGIDFRNKLNELSSIDFTEMFEQWYFGEGFPTYSLKWNQQGNDVIVQVNHTTSEPAITPIFTNPIEIKFNRTPLQDTTVRFTINSNQETFYLENFGTLSTSATAIIDPNNWIINNAGSITQDNSLALSEINENKELVVYPNPTNGTFTIQNVPSNTQVNVLDMFGKIVKSLEFEPNTYIDLSQLKKGNYLLQILLPDNQKRLKIIQL